MARQMDSRCTSGAEGRMSSTPPDLRLNSRRWGVTPEKRPRPDVLLAPSCSESRRLWSSGAACDADVISSGTWREGMARWRQRMRGQARRMVLSTKFSALMFASRARPASHQNLMLKGLTPLHANMFEATRGLEKSGMAQRVPTESAIVRQHRQTWATSGIQLLYCPKRMASWRRQTKISSNISSGSGGWLATLYLWCFRLASSPGRVILRGHRSERENEDSERPHHDSRTGGRDITVASTGGGWR